MEWLHSYLSPEHARHNRLISVEALSTDKPYKKGQPPRVFT